MFEFIAGVAIGFVIGWLVGITHSVRQWHKYDFL